MKGDSIGISGMNTHGITLFAGHYGSGKTNLALNYARYLRRCGAAVAVADLDIVNPYFRTKDSAAALAAEGIELVVSPFANSNVDFPALPKEIYSLVSDTSRAVVIDVGGDDRGALALGRWSDDIRASGNYEMLGVVNFSRPLTRTPEEAVEVLREIEAAAGIAFTGIVNNTNLGPATDAATVLASVPPAERTAEMLGVSVRFTAVRRELAPELEGKIDGIFPLDLQRLYYHLEV